MIEKTVSFKSDGVLCRGILHLPDTGGKAPVVVFANGYATEWQFGTLDFVRAFVGAGLAVLAFDYRGFGNSDGEPRQVVDIQAQLNDWREAIQFAKTCELVDGSKMALWGSSLGGGHVITLAAEYPELKAMVAQVPHCCSNAAFKTVSLGAVFKGMGYALLDNLRNLLGMKPLLIPVLAEPEEYGVMNHPGWKKQYLDMVNPESQWQNAIPARSLIKSGQYRPILVADKIRCPSLVVYGKYDAGIPAESVEATIAKIPSVESYGYEGDHFEVYAGGAHDDIVQRETAFLARQLL